MLYVKLEGLISAKTDILPVYKIYILKNLLDESRWIGGSSAKEELNGQRNKVIYALFEYVHIFISGSMSHIIT